MRNHIGYLVVLILSLSACAPTTSLQVTRLGFEPEEVQEKVIYALPQTLLKISITYNKHVQIPGPYAQYGEKYLGIRNCITKRSENWQIMQAGISAFSEIDPDNYYVINALSGNIPNGTLQQLIDKGFVNEGSLAVDEDFAKPFMMRENSGNPIVFNDVTVDPYQEQKQETMYKTIVTDTSFVQVPVNRTILEKKTLEQKAEEAANFILELRLSRFELLSGYGEVFPDGEAMQATINKMDQLEKEYISLFAGKSYGETFTREQYIIPESQQDKKSYTIGYFSDQLGFVPASLEEGSPVRVEILPSGKTRSLRNLIPQNPEEDAYNQIYYRLPDVADVRILRGDNELVQKRLNIFQLGALVSVPMDVK